MKLNSVRFLAAVTKSMLFASSYCLPVVSDILNQTDFHDFNQFTNIFEFLTCSIALFTEILAHSMGNYPIGWQYFDDFR